MNLTGTQISATYGNLVTIDTVAGTPTTGVLQNGAGTDLAGMTLNGAAVFNEGGGDFDFRVEGDTDANLLFVDASTDRVGIGTNSPDALLTVDGIASFGDGAVGTPSIANQGDLDTGLWFPAANVIAVSTQGAEAARVTANGAVLIGTTSIVSSPDAAGSLIVDDFIGMNLGTNKVYTSQGQVTATTGTVVYTFTTTRASTGQRTTSYVKLSVVGRANTNTAADNFAAEYHFVLHLTNLAGGDVLTLNGQSSIFEYTIDYATDVAFADSGAGVCTLTITNPVGQGQSVGTKVEIQSGFLTNNNFGFNLTSVAYT